MDIQVTQQQIKYFCGLWLRTSSSNKRFQALIPPNTRSICSTMCCTPQILAHSFAFLAFQAPLCGRQNWECFYLCCMLWIDSCHFQSTSQSNCCYWMLSQPRNTSKESHLSFLPSLSAGIGCWKADNGAVSINLQAPKKWYYGCNTLIHGFNVASWCSTIESRGAPPDHLWIHLLNCLSAIHHKEYPKILHSAPNLADPSGN